MADFGSESSEKKEEFFSEAQEIVDGLGKLLLDLEGAVAASRVDPDVINEMFRAVHTLKGIAGLFGATRMSGMSHELENMLDDVRMGRLDLTSNVLDLLFKAVDLYTHILLFERGEAPDPEQEIAKLLASFAAVTQPEEAPTSNIFTQFDLDPGMFGVLTEYEEHRLKSNIESGLALFRLRVRFNLTVLDSALEDLKKKAKPLGEIITYLPAPSTDESDFENLELDILMASKSDAATIDTTLSVEGLVVNPVKRRAGGGPPPKAAAAPVSKSPLPKIGAPPSLPPPTIAGPARVPQDLTPDSQVMTPAAPAAKSVRPAAAARTSMAPQAQGQAAQFVGKSAAQTTVRVDIRKLDRLMTILGELAIVRSAVGRLAERLRGSVEHRELGTDLHRLHRTFERHLGQMQNGILEVRMVQLGPVFDKLQRGLRAISREYSRPVNLVITGQETEIDKLIVEELSDPLMHMVRNAFDHGIELVEDRLKVGKPEVGTIALNAFQKGNHVVIEVEDDGRGMDPKLIIASAIRKGVITEDESREMSARDAYRLVFMPGFSTKTVVTDLSGRGVGLDVVKTNIAKLGGIVDVTSEVGIGTKMTITLPVTLAIINVLIVEIAGRSFAIPLASVEEAFVYDPTLTRNVEGREVLSLRGQSLPICHLSSLFQVDAFDDTTDASRKFYVVTVAVGIRRLGLLVDRLEGQQDIVIKPLGKSLKSVRGFAGAAELGDQRVALVLDVAAIVEEVLAGDQGRFLAMAGDGRG
jgi:two-component system, chemotaxis family, sensor kinase CheA